MREKGIEFLPPDSPALRVNYWLMKSEPDAFSWEDLKKEPGRKSSWDGVRNYQARNYMRDEMRRGDRVFFYHSSVKLPSIMGVAKVVKEAHPDPTALDPDNPHFDPKSSPENPRWFMVEIQYERDFTPPITREELKEVEELREMLLLRKGSRLSVMPVHEKEWNRIMALRAGR